MAVITKRWDDVGAPVLNGVAGSLIAVLDAVLVTAAGWTKEFTGTNKAVYRPPIGGNRFYLRVDDSFGTYARVVGYESMTGVDTGTNPFPTAAQFSGGLYSLKANDTSATARQWVIAVSDRLFHMYVNSYSLGTTPLSYGFMWSFGDLKSEVTGDAYGTVLIGGNNSGTSANQFGVVGTSVACHYIARSYTALGGSVQSGKLGDSLFAGSGSLGTFGLSYPSASGGVYVAPIRIFEGSAVLRGVLPGVWQLMHGYASINHLDTFSGSGAFSGKTFMHLHQYNGNAVLLETSNTWDA